MLGLPAFCHRLLALPFASPICPCSTPPTPELACNVGTLVLGPVLAESPSTPQSGSNQRSRCDHDPCNQIHSPIPSAQTAEHPSAIPKSRASIFTHPNQVNLTSDTGAELISRSFIVFTDNSLPGLKQPASSVHQVHGLPPSHTPPLRFHLGHSSKDSTAQATTHAGSLEGCEIITDLTFWEQNPEHVSTVTLASTREVGKVCVTFSGSRKHPR